MTRDRRLAVVILVLSIHMILQQLAIATDNPSRKYSVEHREDDQNSASKPTDPTTNFPVNPYVFSAEDYDVLQNAETVQKAQSIVAYEPQKIDAKKSEGKETISKEVVVPSTITQQSTFAPQQLIGNKHRDLSQKRSRSQSRGKTLIESRGSTAAASEVSEVASKQKQAFNRALALHPYVSSFSRDSKEVGSTSPPILTQVSTSANHGDNYPSLKSSKVDQTFGSNKIKQRSTEPKIDHNSSGTIQKAEDIPAVKKKRRRSQKISQPIAEDQEQASLIVRSDRIPRPFGFTTSSHTAETLLYPTKASDFIQNPIYHSVSSAERKSALTVPVRQYASEPKTTVPAEVYRQNFRQEQIVPTVLPGNQEYASTYETVPLRRNPRRRQQIPIRHTSENYPTSYTNQQQPTVYTIPRRSERTVIRSTAPTREDQPDELKRDYQVVPLRRGSARYSASTEQPEVNTLVELSERLAQYSKISSRQKVDPPDVDYDQDIIPPTAPVEQQTIQQQPIIHVSEHKKKRGRRTKPISVRPHNDQNDNKQYSYSHVERYEEPSNEESKEQTNSYRVTEDITDVPNPTQSLVPNEPATRKKPEPHTDDPPQYTDTRAVVEQDYDDDQTKGQNVQQTQQVAKIQEAPDDKQDLDEEADHQHKTHHKPKEEHHEEEEAGSEEHHEGEHHEDGEKGEKGYKEFEEHDEGKKGHHDKEDHKHHYDEKDGKAKDSSEEKGFHEEHEKGEEGEKKSGFSEKGKHKKGHSTKGEHVIHKKDEFEKKTEFFDEFHDEGDFEKDGGHHEEHAHKKGGHFKKGHHHHGHHKGEKGEKGHHEKGHHHHDKKGHHEDEGHHHHHEHEEKHGKKGGHGDSKHWHHKKGDRR